MADEHLLDQVMAPPALTTRANDPLLDQVMAQEPHSPSRGLGLGVRSVADGALGLPMLAMDAATYPGRAIGRAMGLPVTAPSDMLQSGMDAVGLPKPETFWERRASHLIEGGAGVVPMMAGGAALRGASAVGSLGARIAARLMASPGAQAVSGAGAAAGADAADGMGAGAMGRAAGALIGGVVAPAVGARIAVPVQSQLNPEAQRLAQQAAAEGIPLTAGQQTGSRPLRTVESVFDTLPLTSGPQAEVRQAQGAAFNRAVMRRAGADADNATPATLQANRDRLGNEFDRLTQTTTVQFDQQLMNDLGATEARYLTKLPSQQRPAFTAYLDDILNAGQGGGIPGPVYQQARSDLTRQAHAARASDPFFADALRGLRGALDDAAGRSIPAADQEAWQAARAQYGNQRRIENAMAGAGADAATGNVPPVQLRTAATAGDRSGYARGQGDMNDLARVGQAFLRAPADSGTAGRAAITSMLQMGGVGGGATMAGAGLPGSIAAAAASLFAPRAAQLLINSPAGQRYLTEGIPGLSGVVAPMSTRAIQGVSVAAQQADQRDAMARRLAR